MYGIEEARQQLLESFAGLSNTQLNKSIESDTWSINQILEHLYFMELGVTAHLKKGLQTEDCPVSEKKPLERTLNRSYKVKAPEKYQPYGHFLTYDEITRLLSESRMKLLEVIDHIENPTVLVEKSLKHTVFGQMNLAQWIEFIGWHEKRHTQQIEEVKEKLF